MKNLVVYAGEFLNKNKFKIIPLVVAGGIFCGFNKTHEDYSDYSLSSITNALHKDDDLTNVDNYLLSGVEYDGKVVKLEDLEQTLVSAYYDREVETCNKIISAMSKAVLKAQVADGYNLDYDKIEKFDVLGHKAESSDYIDTYGVSFTYDNENYKIRAHRNSGGIYNHYAGDLCFIARAADKNQILLNGGDWHVPNTYEYIKEYAVRKFDYKNFKPKKKNYYDGWFDLYKNNNIKKVVKENLKDEDKVSVKLYRLPEIKETEEVTTTKVEETTKGNNLPVKVKTKK